ncbi:MAG: cadmium-translocating P-type ATPase [Alphaproteobacteria bacterium]|nr:cadmium-translocating P-type ATPase [Alphaproteobacteria bacterium]
MTAATFSQALDIDPAPFVRRDGKGEARLELAVKGVRCANCIAKIERGLAAMPGIESARVNLSTAKLSVRWRDGRANAQAIVKRISELGFESFPYDPDAVLTHEQEEGRFLLRCLAVAGFAAANVMLLSITIWSGGEMGDATRTMFLWVSALIAVPSAIYASRPFLRSAVASLSQGHANMDVPITLAILLALALSMYETATGGQHAYFDAAVALPFLLLTGRYLDFLLRRKARGAARDLAAMQTVTATRIDAAGHTQTVAPRDIAVGDKLLIATGERTPVDCVVEAGSGDVDVSLATGESAPVTAAIGDKLHAGSLVLGAPLTVRCTARVEDSLVAEVARLLEAGQQSRGRYVRLADRAAALYVPLVHGAALSVFLGSLLFGEEVRVALTSAISLLIITCPCAMGLAVPAVQVVATSRLYRRGLLVKSGDALERLAEADTALLDKTGTLTTGRPDLLRRDSLPSNVLAEAAKLARASRHPLARALANAAGPGPLARDTREIAGEGIEGLIDGKRARLGKASFVGVGEETDPNSSALWFAFDGEKPIRFAFADALRADAAASIRGLSDRGLEIEILSGDRTGPVAEVAQQTGVAHWQANVDPRAKAEHLEALKTHGHRTLMVGDGLNDAAALALAHVSISPGTAAAASQAAADMVLQGETLAPIVEGIDVARSARRRVLENFAFAAIYNAVAVPLAAFGLVTPLIAAIAMSASSLIVMLNAIRLGARS